MTMAEQNPVGHLLDGMVHCRNCNTPMATEAAYFGETPMYVCPNRRSGCDTPEIPAEPFTRLVVERVIRAALEGSNTKRVAETVQEDARQRIKEYTDAREVLEARPTPRTVMDVLDPPPPDLSSLDPEMRRLLELDPGQYIEPLRRLDRYWNVSGDTGHVEQYALDLDTYLRPSNIQTTKAIIETAVAEIRVGASSAAIRYRAPMPPGSGAQDRTQEEVDLPT